MVLDKAHDLARELRGSEEYAAYCAARDVAMENETTKTLIDEYHRLQMKAQATTMSGQPNEELMEKLKKIGEVLQFDKDASAFLFAEFRLNRLLGDVYKILADAIDIDLSALES